MQSSHVMQTDRLDESSCLYNLCSNGHAIENKLHKQQCKFSQGHVASQIAMHFEICFVHRIACFEPSCMNVGYACTMQPLGLCLAGAQEAILRWSGQTMKMCNGCSNKLINVVQSTTSMLFLGGLGACPPGNF